MEIQSNSLASPLLKNSSPTYNYWKVMIQNQDLVCFLNLCCVYLNFFGSIPYALSLSSDIVGGPFPLLGFLFFIFFFVFFTIPGCEGGVSAFWGTTMFVLFGFSVGTVESAPGLLFFFFFFLFLFFLPSGAAPVFEFWLSLSGILVISSSGSRWIFVFFFNIEPFRSSSCALVSEWVLFLVWLLSGSVAPSAESHWFSDSCCWEVWLTLLDDFLPFPFGRCFGRCWTSSSVSSSSTSSLQSEKESNLMVKYLTYR